jgi:hypothetical protein
MSRFDRLTAVISVALVCAGATGAIAAPIISVGPYSRGPTFAVPVEISGAVDLVTWQFDLSFDPTDLQAISVSEGPFTSSNGQFLTLFVPGVIDNVGGLVSLVAGAYLDLPPGPSGDGVLALIEFTSIGDGQSPIAIEDSTTVDSSGTTVPEPGTLVGVGLGLSLIGWRRLPTRSGRCRNRLQEGKA